LGKLHEVNIGMNDVAYLINTMRQDETLSQIDIGGLQIRVYGSNIQRIDTVYFSVNPARPTYPLYILLNPKV
jgi:hypothetical protein